MDKNKVFNIVVGAFIKNSKNEYLIIRRSKHDTLPGLWELPSGKKEFLESAEEAVSREVLEEVGINIKVIGLVGYFEYSVEKDYEIRDTVQLNFYCEVITNPLVVILSNDHDNYAWVDKNTIDKYTLSESTKNCLLKVLNAPSIN